MSVSSRITSQSIEYKITSFSDFSEIWDDVLISANSAWDAITNPIKTFEIFKNSPAANAAEFIYTYGPERVLEMMQDSYNGTVNVNTSNTNFDAMAQSFFFERKY